MLFILGSLALLQMIFLPGALLYKKTAFRGNFVQNTMFIFGGSLILNYCGVFLLVALHAYTRIVVFPLFLIEIFLFVKFYRQELSSSFEKFLQNFWKRWEKIFRDIAAFQSQREAEFMPRFLLLLLWIFSAIFAGIGLWWAIKLIFHTIGTIFTTWDAIVSWNRWATEWAQNQLPTHTWRYAQLIPTTRSLPYIFMGNSQIQFFSKSIMPLFNFCILLMLFDLGISKKQPGYLLGGTFAYLMIKKLLGAWVATGYSDLALSFFGFLSIYILLKHSEDESDETLEKRIFWGIFFAAGAAATKQPGIYLLGIYPALLYFSFLRPRYKNNWKKMLQILWKPFLLAGIIVLPWYLYKEISFLYGIDTPETQGIIAASQNVLKTTSPLIQTKLALLQLGKYLILWLSLLPLLYFMDSLNRGIVLLIVFPFVLLWTQLASYSTRNLALVVPLIAMTSGVGIGNALEKGIWWSQKIPLQKIKLWSITAFGILLLLFGGVFLKDNALIEREIALQQTLFSAPLNQYILNYASQHPNSNLRILTDYHLEYIPGLEDTKVSFSFRDFETFQEKIQEESITHLLVPENASEEIKAFIEEKLSRGEYTLLYKNTTWKPYRFIQISPTPK